MIDYKVIGARLKGYRTRLNMTQETLAESVDITTVYLSKIENGHVRPTLDLLGQLCSALNCDLGTILLNTSPTSSKYQNEEVINLFNACAPKVKPIALELLDKLSKLQ